MPANRDKSAEKRTIFAGYEFEKSIDDFYRTRLRWILCPTGVYVAGKERWEAVRWVWMCSTLVGILVIVEMSFVDKHSTFHLDKHIANDTYIFFGANSKILHEFIGTN